jgi:hypothetical protein
VADGRSSKGRATSAAGAVTGEIVSFWTTDNVYACVAERAPSDTRTVKVKSPPAVGVPEISPPELSCIPAGSEPEASDQVWLPPPLAVSWKLYGVCSVVAFGASAVCTMLSGTAGAPPPTVIVNSR